MPKINLGLEVAEKVTEVSSRTNIADSVLGKTVVMANFDASAGVVNTQISSSDADLGSK